MRRLAGCIAAAILTAGPLDASSEVIDFTGPYAPDAWTTTILGSAGGSSVIASPTTVTLIGADSGVTCVGGVSGVLGSCELRYVTPTIVDNPFSFHWEYETADDLASEDQFGVIVDGTKTVLVDLAGPHTQSGDFTGMVVTSFGWFINCTDCTGGAATVTITNFRVGTPTAIPEPATLVLFALGLAGLGFSRRKRISD